MGLTLTVKKGYLYVSFAYKYQQKLFSTGVKLENKDQVNDTGTVHRNKRQPQTLEDKSDSLKIKEKLSFFDSTVVALEAQNVLPDVGTIAELYNEKYNSTQNTQKPKLVKKQLISDYINEYLEHKRRTGISERSQIGFTNTLSRIDQELFIHKQYKLKDIDKDFGLSFYQYLISKSAAVSTYNTYIVIFKNFCKYLVEMELITDKQYRDFSKYVKLKQAENETDIALSKEEFTYFSEFSELSRIRTRHKDCFVAQTQLGGLRHSDFVRITSKDYDAVGRVITINTKKTKKPLVIPVTETAQAIIEKYIDIDNPDKPIFRTGVIDAYNRALREIAYKVYYIDNEEKVYPFRKTVKVNVQLVGAEDRTQLKPLYMLFKSSLARRTFITTMLDAKYDFTLIAKITGHSTSTSFKKYIKLSNTNKQNIIEDVFKVPHH